MDIKMRFVLNNFIAVTNYYLRTNNLFLKNARTYCVAVTSNNKPNDKTVVAPVEAPQNVDVQQKSQQRSLHIAVIGVPNAGKSTFINNLINHRVCPTSCKVHTTCKANKAIFTTGQTQLVFYDTPGLVTQRQIKKHNLEKSFKSAYRYAVQNADVIAVMHDVSNSWTRNELHSTVLDTLKAYPALPSFLVLNKIDALKSKRVLLDLIRILTNETLVTTSSGNRKPKQKGKTTQVTTEKKESEEVTGDNGVSGECDSGFSELHKREISWSHFEDVFLVSSITGNGLSDIHDYLVDAAKERSWQYSSETFSDETPETLIVDSVRARLLDYLPQEIPYNLKSVIEYYSEENNTIYASVQVICPSVRVERLICGESNGKLRQITERVTSDLVETFGKPISLTIATTSKNAKK